MESKGEPSPGVPPFFLWVCTCAPIRWVGVVALSCDSTPFLWCLPKETVSSRQRKALFYLGVSTIRVSATSRWTIRSSPDLGEGAGGCRGIVRVRRFLGRWIVAPTANSTPFLCSCAKKRGGAPKKRADGCRHGRCWVPPASPTDSKPQHHSRLRQADFARPIVQPASNQLDAPIRPVGAYAQMGEAGGPTKVMWRLQSAFLWRLDTVSLGKHQRNGVERQGKVKTPAQRIGAHAQTQKTKAGTPNRGSR